MKRKYFAVVCGPAERKVLVKVLKIDFFFLFSFFFCHHLFNWLIELFCVFLFPESPIFFNLFTLISLLINGFKNNNLSELALRNAKFLHDGAN